MKSNYPCGACGDPSAPYNLPDAVMLQEMTVQLRLPENTFDKTHALEMIQQLGSYVKGEPNDLVVEFSLVCEDE